MAQIISFPLLSNTAITQAALRHAVGSALREDAIRTALMNGAKVEEGRLKAYLRFDKPTPKRPHIAVSVVIRESKPTKTGNARE